MRLISAALVVLMVACMANAQSAIFYPTKDNVSDRYQPSDNAGAVPYERGAKAMWREDISYYDFDTAAIQAFLDANSLTVNQVQATFYLRPYNWDQETAPAYGFEIRTLISGNDWAEGTGENLWAGAPLWDPETGPAATYAWAQAVNYYDEASNSMVIDTAASLPWKASAASGGRNYENLRDMLLNGPTWNGAEGLANSVDWYLDSVNLGYTGVVLDTAILADMLTNPENRGLLMWDAHHNNSNWMVYFREAGEGFTPYLEIAVVPEPATMALLALGGLALIRRRRA